MLCKVIGRWTLHWSNYLLVVNLQDVFQVQVLQQLIEFVTWFHRGLLPSPSAENTPGRRGAGSCARRGRGRRVCSGLLRARRPEAVRGDTRAPGAGVGAKPGRLACGSLA